MKTLPNIIELQLLAVDFKDTYIGRFENEEEAARAYDAIAKELYGEFTNLNFKE